MLRRIANTLILGKPLVMYLGMLTLLIWLLAISVVVLDKTGRLKRHSVWHGRLVAVALALALVHMTLGLSLFF